MELTLPLTKEIAKTLKVGDIIYLTGFVYTCRDAAHKKIEIALKHGEKPPVDLKTRSFTMQDRVRQGLAYRLVRMAQPLQLEWIPL